MEKRERKPRWFRFWERASQEQVKAIERLTQALVDMEQGRVEGNRALMELVQDPERMGGIMRAALLAAQGPMFPAPEGPSPALLMPPEELERRTAATTEAVKAAVDTVSKAVLDKMEQMEAHIREAVRELPPSTLLKIAKRIEDGYVFTLRRRHGCVHIDFGVGDEEFYLRL